MSANDSVSKADKWDMSKERERIDNLLGQRINFLLVFFALALMVNGHWMHAFTTIRNSRTASLALAQPCRCCRRSPSAVCKRGSTRYSRKFTPLRPTLRLWRASTLLRGHEPIESWVAFEALQLREVVEAVVVAALQPTVVIDTKGRHCGRPFVFQRLWEKPTGCPQCYVP